MNHNAAEKLQDLTKKVIQKVRGLLKNVPLYLFFCFFALCSLRNVIIIMKKNKYLTWDKGKHEEKCNEKKKHMKKKCWSCDSLSLSLSLSIFVWA